MDHVLKDRVEALERANRRLARGLWVQGAVVLALLAAIGVSCASIGRSGRATGEAPALRTRELVVVDGKGVERVRIGGDLPDAVIRGKRVPRGSQAAGILLYDDTGQERSGYVTFSPNGNVGITFDTREKQVAYLVADPEEGAALRLWEGDGMVDLRADDDGARLTANRAGSVVFQQPELRDPTKSSSCRELRNLQGQHPAEVLRKACQERMTDAACRECLGGA